MRAHLNERLTSLRSAALVCVCVVAFGLGLQGCASNQAAAFDAARLLLSRGDQAALTQQPLNPKYRYLRVTFNGHPVLLVLGYVDQLDSASPVEVWYSGSGEVLRLRHGRLAGLVGTPAEWRDVRWPQGVPAWQAALQQTPPPYERVLDQMPGYRLGAAQSLQIEALATPRDTAWAGNVPADLRWFRESVVSGAGAYPPARYAVKLGPQGAQPVYGEQCIAADLCITWQTWAVDQGLRS
ncbi:MAG: YjbF family lipoprotein [Aquabacterium sp.]|jgi:hypothetical protein|uniref:YjbF family lipoprotein n=1 Tax=Aquabacterium sp. TaxID=1872578 RepID=UPI003BAFE304